MLVVPVALILSGLIVHAVGQVARLDGTSTTQFAIRANGATPTTMMAGDDGDLVLPNGLTVSGGVINYYGAAVSDLSSVTTCDINGGTIDGTPIGGAVPAAGAFTSLAATTADINGGTIDGAAIGSSSPSSAAFTTVSASGQITSMVTTGTAPFVVGSSTQVSNLRASYVGVYQVSGCGDGCNGGVVFQNNSTQLSQCASGANGQFLTSHGSTPGNCMPTWTGLTQGKLWIGNASNIPTETGLATGYIWVGQSGLPTAVVMSGDATLNSSGVLSLAVNSVQSTEIVDGNVTEAKIATGAVTEAKIGGGAVTAAKLRTGAVTEAKIGAGAVTAAKLPSDIQDLLPVVSISQSGEAANEISATVTIMDAAGNAAERPWMIPWVISDTAYSASETSQSPTVTVVGVTGPTWETLTANKKGVAFSSSGGVLVIHINLAGDHTVYLNVVVAGQVYSQAVNFD